MPDLVITEIPETDFAALEKAAEESGLSVEDYATKLISEAVNQHIKSLQDVDHPLAAARARGESRLAQLLSREDMCTAAELARLLGISCQRVNDLWQAHRIIGIASPIGVIKHPRWQFHPDGTLLDGLEDALAILGDNGMTAYRILCGIYPDGKDGTIYQSLRDGKKEHVLKCLQAIARGDFF